jgi:hypothetical protein
MMNKFGHWSGCMNAMISVAPAGVAKASGTAAQYIGPISVRGWPRAENPNRKNIRLGDGKIVQAFLG